MYLAHASFALNMTQDMQGTLQPSYFFLVDCKPEHQINYRANKVKVSRKGKLQRHSMMVRLQNGLVHA